MVYLWQSLEVSHQNFSSVNRVRSRKGRQDKVQTTIGMEVVMYGDPIKSSDSVGTRAVSHNGGCACVVSEEV